ncbi:MAG: N4-gp56 family major capsid protein [Candidatus Omnitrophota bacterium]|nr:MAG: N4-gp56 family major capsid protein [Candidatus Omnitrophota bacterium]
MANIALNADITAKIWSKEVYANIIDNLYFNAQGMMGEGQNNIVQIQNDFQKKKGDTKTFSLTAKHSPTAGVSSGELEGNESRRDAYSETVTLAQYRCAERLDGKLDEQKNAFDLRSDARDKLSIQGQEFIERQIFLKMGGVTNQLITTINGDCLGTFDDGTNFLTWSNSPDKVPDADSAAGYGARYLCADYTNGADSLASTDLLTPELISRAAVKASTSTPKMIPLRVGGENFWIMFIHPWQALDLKNNARFDQSRREAAVRGKDNPIFTGALGIWDKVILKEHEYVPFLDISVAGNNFAASGSGTDFSADCFRALLCGRQAVGFMRGKNTNEWVEETFDYGNQTGFATSIIGGIQKLMFNSKAYGVIQIDTAATALV